MIRFVKQLYLTGFAVIFRLSRSKDVDNRAGGAIGLITLIEWFILIGILFYVQILVGSKFVFAKPVVIISFIALLFVNLYFLAVRRHGIKFEREFDSLEKPRRIALVVSCAVVAVASIVFVIHSGIAFSHFLRIHN